MIQLIIVILASAIIAYSLGLRIERLLPVVMMATVIITYSFALFISLGLSVYITLAIIMIITALLCIFGKRKSAERGFSYVFTPQILIALLMCLCGFYAFSTHRVIHWDDLNVWGIYPKTLYYIGHLPTGIENCSITYKDYQPVQQIMQYFFIFNMKEFPENRLFQINVCFMYILCLPMLNGLTNKPSKIRMIIKNIIVIALYIVFPHVFTTQFYSKLGVDYLISILFGICIYDIYCIYDNPTTGVYNSGSISKTGQQAVDIRDKISHVFRYISLSVAMSYLALIKSSGITLVLLLIIFMFIMNGIRKYSITNVISIIYYFSWKIFAKRTGNTGYMSETIDSNLRSLIHNIPSYTSEVLLHYIKNVFTYALTREKIGITAFIMLVIIAVIFFACRDKLPKKAIITLAIGFVLFCIGHLYMYLFVFDEWEAHGLMEFDRYICQYLAGVLLFSIILLLRIGPGSAQSNTIIPNPKEWLPAVILLVFIALFPYKAAKTYLVPSHYTKMFNHDYIKTFDAGIAELESSKLKDRNIPIDEDNRILLVANAWDDAVIYFTYAAVPHAITAYANVPAVEAGTLYTFMCYMLENTNAGYVYVCNNAKESYPGDFDTESASITTDGAPLEAGFYKVSSDLKLSRLD